MKVARTQCPKCGKEQSYWKPAVNNIYDKKIECSGCGQRFKPKKIKRGASDNQKRSRDQEDRAAKRYNAKRQSGSGSSHRAKGDLKGKGLRGECKETTAKEYRLKLAELLKLQSEARGMEEPLFEIEFQGVHPYQRFVVLPGDRYAAMREELEVLREANSDNQ